MSWKRWKRKVRNREGRLADLVYRCYKAVQHFNVYPVPGLYHLLAAERSSRRELWFWLKRKFYDEPVFKLRCASCGRGFNLLAGIPLVYGDLELHIGDHVTMHGTTTLNGTKVFARPRLVIGNRTHCGSSFGVSVGADVVIGDDVLIASHVGIFSYDSHPLDAEERRRGLPASPESSRPIYIHDKAWICTGAVILKGVTIGEGGIVATGAVVTEDVPAYTVVAGNPARVVKRLAANTDRTAALANIA